MIFEIYYSPAGLGLAKDAKILREALVSMGHSVVVTELPKVTNSLRSNINEKIVSFFCVIGLLFIFKKFQRLLLPKPIITTIHLEKIFYWKLFSHRRQVLVPNQEWFNPKHFSLLLFIDHVWAKTSFAKDIFLEFKPKVHRIGFCSIIDAPDESERERKYFFSRVGMSRFRGAELLVNLWRRHPEWPVLKLIIDKSCRPLDPPRNVEYLDIFLNHSDYMAFSNAALFHIYATEMEGFGHSIVEAMGSGAIVLVTDAPPMNEIANPDCALMIGASYAGQKWLSPRFSVNPVDMERAIISALDMSDEDIQKMVSNAVSRPDELKRDFYKNLAIAIQKL